MHTQLRVTHPLSGQLKSAIATLLSAVVAGLMGAALPSVSPSMGELGVMLFLISGVAYLAAWVWLIYLLFSPIGLVNGLSPAFWPAVGSVIVVNGLLCWLSLKYWHKKYAQKLYNNPEH